MSKAPSVKTKEPASPVAAETEGGEGLADSPPQENLDRIRSILFGAQSRDYEQRLVKLEQRITSETSTLRSEIDKRFDTLEALLRKQVELVQERLRSEHGERSEGVHKLTESVDALGKSNERRAQKLEELIGKVQRELRQELIEQVGGVSDELRQSHSELGKQIERETQALRGSKVDRTALSHLLSDLATRVGS